MRIVIPRESVAGERRTSATPETVKKMIRLGADVAIESDAGAAVGYDDSLYSDLGAEIVSDRAALMGSADMVLRLRTPEPADIDMMKPGCIHVSYLDPFNERDLIKTLAAKEITAVSMEMIPRSTRSQKMDALSSQANLAGYVAVMLAAAQLPSIFPMLMTPAGTLKPAKIFIIGAGVAGLQAIATAKRLGAVIEASDVRPSVKEQIESLGGKFIDVPYETDEEREIAQGVGGYARPMPASWMQRQAILVAERAKQADIVITTALIPGRKAPMLLAAETVQAMKPGSVIVDLAAGKGENGSGNCPLTEADQIVIKHGVTLIGLSNLPAEVAADASALYARNVLDFLKLIVTNH